MLQKWFTAVCMVISLSMPALSAQTLPPPVPVSGNWQLQYTSKTRGHGEKISALGYNTAGWYKATVPGTVLTTLVDNKVYPEPLYGEITGPHLSPTACRE